ncbi:uncharacterized protein B0H18DRAFT_1031912 [Fomitopsis serialis]|uniref:uncharacterized protein n=1 Tax=Fomitopsis serialis TaxID=139415 RepID=UPI00200881C3|nr:uncharacterized protein B0H18DRAFT_1031912 [Neoantrodia serialis]KAH9918281.1 hypothetical protein B0H18DRAFT_1031912 [Neoantrodia serialis]
MEQLALSQTPLAWAHWPAYIRNALQIPVERAWLTFVEMARTYGDVMHFSAFGRSIVILDSRKAVFDLLEKRSAIYSDRPRSVLAGEMIGYAEFTVMCRYGSRLKDSRKIISLLISPRILPEINAIQESQAQLLLPRLLNAPDEFLTHIRWYDLPATSIDTSLSLAEQRTIQQATVGPTATRLLYCSLPYMPSIEAQQILSAGGALVPSLTLLCCVCAELHLGLPSLYRNGGAASRSCRNGRLPTPARIHCARL